MKFYFLVFFNIFLICFNLEANELGTPQVSMQEQVNYIELKIKNLQSELDIYELDESNEEVDSQNYMIADWPKFAEEVQKEKIKRIKIEKIKDEIKFLENQKRDLIHELN